MTDQIEILKSDINYYLRVYNKAKKFIPNTLGRVIRNINASHQDGRLVKRESGEIIQEPIIIRRNSNESR